MSKPPASEIKSTAGIVMVRVPAGSFTVGSPESEDGHQAWEQQREVTFANDLYLTGSIDLAPPIDGFPKQERPPSIYDAISANDFDLALRVIRADPAAVESVDAIPPPLHDCITDNPQMLEWLLDHGADIERREQDYGSTALLTAVVTRQGRMIPILVRRGACTEGALKRARNGLAGAYEDAGFDREGYREIVELLQTLRVEE